MIHDEQSALTAGRLRRLQQVLADHAASSGDASVSPLAGLVTVVLAVGSLGVATAAAFEGTRVSTWMLALPSRSASWSAAASLSSCLSSSRTGAPGAGTWAGTGSLAAPCDPRSQLSRTLIFQPR